MVYRSIVLYNISQKFRLSVTDVYKAVGGEMGAVDTPVPPPSKKKRKKKKRYFGTKISFF